ncbi:P2R3A phosphatase, partial [Atractosteus spatula]|nr:P2R3A phosphatase [Atractosteus spatula]
MAATYRIIVSTVNCYNSVVIDRRFQHTVHYCSGPCQVLKHGIECTVAHHSTCAELLEAPVAPASSARPSGAQELGNKFSAVENGNAAPEAMSEDYHQVLPGAPRIKKGLAIQGSTSLKDITGEAINLASGKIKEFSFEKIKYSSSHVTFRKGRKVRPDSFSRRSTDLDIIYGHFGNDENCPPFGMLQKSVMEEHKLSRSSSLEQNVNNVATLYLNSLTEENLINKILEKTKMDSNASGEDIKACLDILLKCSEDLKKCTDIIKQCIKRKSMGVESDDSSTNPELIYRNVMARLSSYLKKLPFEFEHGLPGRSEHNDLAELVNSLHGLQQSPFSPIFGNEQPPRYEDVVHSPPLTKTLPPSSLLESQEASREPVNNVKSVQSPSSLPSHTSSLANNVQQNTMTAANSSTSLPQVTAINHSDSYSSTNSLLSSSNDSICKESMEALYIEEDPDLGKVLDKELRGEGKFSLGFTEVKQFSKKPSTFAETSDESRVFQTLGHSNQEDDIDKLLMDLECLSQNMEQEPSMKGNSQKVVNCSQQPGSVQHLIFSSGSKSHPPPAVTSPLPGKKDTSRQGGDVNDEEDGALLLRILESIESFAQELVESGTGKGTLSREREVMRLLQDTLVTTAKSEQKSQPGPVPAAVRDTGPSLLIQQTPEVIRDLGRTQSVKCLLVFSIGAPCFSFFQTPSNMMIKETSLRRDPDLRGELAFLARGCDFVLPSRFKKRLKSFQQAQVQNKQEKKPGTPPPAPTSSTPSPRPPTPPPAHKVVVATSLSVNIPRFYFPKGLPNCSANLDETIAKIEAAFTEFEEEKADIYEMGKIAKACNCPLYWKAPMFNGTGGERTGFVSVHAFIATWRKLLLSCYDDASKFVYLLAKPGCNYLEQEDFIPLLQDVVDTHPGLTFLKDAPEFHSRYITTVIQRIFYTVNRSWSGRITMTELRRSNFLQTLALLEEEDDINQITDYFSYEHFYVIYCKFWELDTDHDLFIDQKDLARYNDHASSNRIIERIFSGAVTRGNSVQKAGRMSYADFVWFLISEEDKKNPTSVEYWFRCMDLDGDGVLSMYELEHFYEEQCERMEGMGIEPLPFHDLLCQMLDLVKPEQQGRITLHDLKRCRMAHIFYDTFFNLEKYLDHEQRDPFAVQKDADSEGGPEPSDWDKYAAEEYEILVAEESANEQLQEG